MFNKYSRKENTNSIYCYPESEIYINKFNIRDAEILSKVEAELTFNRLSELIYNPVKGKFDIDHISRIHEYIF